ncbi:MAG TPA: GNAT family N-acetyltransferase [Caulobacteraceae bacterium]|jgi:ribosomal-protein-alanine N-acetyltransferase
MDSILHTARLTLRPLDAGDAAPSARIMSPAIARWTGSWTGSETAEAVQQRIDRYLDSERSGVSFNRAMVVTATGALIGWIGVRRLDAEPERGSLGYWLGEAWFGLGYTKEAARAIVDAAWDALGVEVLEGAAQVANLASHKVLLGVGMRHMGQRQEFATARGAADLCDWYELRRPTWPDPGADSAGTATRSRRAPSPRP